MRALVIYDSTGKIYYIGYGDTVVPKGLQYCFIDIPEGKQLISINPTNQQPIFVDVGSIDNLNQQVKSLNEVVDNLLVMALSD